MNMSRLSLGQFRLQQRQAEERAVREAAAAAAAAEARVAAQARNMKVMSEVVELSQRRTGVCDKVDLRVAAEKLMGMAGGSVTLEPLAPEVRQFYHGDFVLEGICGTWRCLAVWQRACDAHVPRIYSAPPRRVYCWLAWVLC